MGLGSMLFGGGGGKFTDEASRLYDKLEVPELSEQELLLQQYVNQGYLTPEEAQAQLVESNGYDSMELDTQGKEAQMAALMQLQEIGNEGGLTASDRSKLQAIQNQEQAASRGSREAIIQNAQARGMGGSGLELMAQLQNQQDSATRQSTRDLDVAAMAQERALQALQSAGSLGGQINQQQFGQQQAIADSKNEIAKFNANNSQQVNLTNTAANNAAQQANLQNKQQLANANVDLGNQQQQYNKELKQTQFGNQLSKVSGQAGALQQQAENANAQKAANQGLFGTLLGAGATFASGGSSKKKG